VGSEKVLENFSWGSWKVLDFFVSKRVNPDHPVTFVLHSQSTTRIFWWICYLSLLLLVVVIVILFCFDCVHCVFSVIVFFPFCLCPHICTGASASHWAISFRSLTPFSALVLHWEYFVNISPSNMHLNASQLVQCSGYVVGTPAFDIGTCESAVCFRILNRMRR